MKLLNFSKAILVSAALIVCSAGVAGEQAKKLTDCVYQNMTPEDKKIMVQWAFVSLARLPVNEEISTIPPETIKAVQKEARSSLRTLVFKKCGKDFTETLVDEKIKGLQIAATDLAIRLVNDNIKRKRSRLPADLAEKNLDQLLDSELVNVIIRK